MQGGETDDLEADMQTIPLHGSPEVSEGISLTFEDKQDEARFAHMLRMLQWCMVIYSATTAITKCSSNYTAHPSNLDAVLLSADILTVDVSSCFFVMCGFVATYVYSSVGCEVWATMRLRVMAQQFGNMWLSTVFILFFGVIDKIVKNRLHVEDVGLTILEGVTGLRVFDARQSVDAPHTFNVALWPVQSLAWSLLSVHGTYHTNELLRGKFGDVANYVILGLSLCGITLFTVFGMLHSETNVFYANATSVMYRMLEFNLGIHYFYLTERRYTLVESLTRIMAQCSPLVYALFMITWWSEIGVAPGTRNTAVCLRLYPRNNCLHDHHAFLLRGCALGLTLLSAVSPSGFKGSIKDEITRTQVCAVAVALCWPAYIATELIFIITFSEALVFENTALMSIFMLIFLHAGSFVYAVGLQSKLTDHVEEFVKIVLSAVRRAKAGLVASCASVPMEPEPSFTPPN